MQHTSSTEMKRRRRRSLFSPSLNPRAKRVKTEHHQQQQQQHHDDDGSLQQQNEPTAEAIRSVEYLKWNLLFVAEEQQVSGQIENFDTSKIPEAILTKELCRANTDPHYYNHYDNNVVDISTTTTRIPKILAHLILIKLCSSDKREKDLLLQFWRDYLDSHCSHEHLKSVLLNRRNLFISHGLSIFQRAVVMINAFLCQVKYFMKVDADALLIDDENKSDTDEELKQSAADVMARTDDQIENKIDNLERVITKVLIPEYSAFKEYVYYGKDKKYLSEFVVSNLRMCSAGLESQLMCSAGLESQLKSIIHKHRRIFYNSLVGIDGETEEKDFKSLLPVEEEEENKDGSQMVKKEKDEEDGDNKDRVPKEKEEENKDRSQMVKKEKDEDDDGDDKDRVPKEKEEEDRSQRVKKEKDEDDGDKDKLPNVEKEDEEEEEGGGDEEEEGGDEEEEEEEEEDEEKDEDEMNSSKYETSYCSTSSSDTDDDDFYSEQEDDEEMFYKDLSDDGGDIDKTIMLKSVMPPSAFTRDYDSEFRGSLSKEIRILDCCKTVGTIIPNANYHTVQSKALLYRLVEYDLSYKFYNCHSNDNTDPRANVYHILHEMKEDSADSDIENMSVEAYYSYKNFLKQQKTNAVKDYYRRKKPFLQTTVKDGDEDYVRLLQRVCDIDDHEYLKETVLIEYINRYLPYSDPRRIEFVYGRYDTDDDDHRLRYNEASKLSIFKVMDTIHRHRDIGCFQNNHYRDMFPLPMDILSGLLKYLMFGGDIQSFAGDDYFIHTGDRYYFCIVPNELKLLAEDDTFKNNIVGGGVYNFLFKLKSKYMTKPEYREEFVRDFNILFNSPDGFYPYMMELYKMKLDWYNIDKLRAFTTTLAKNLIYAKWYITKLCVHLDIIE